MTIPLIKAETDLPKRFMLLTVLLKVKIALPCGQKNHFMLVFIKNVFVKGQKTKQA